MVGLLYHHFVSEKLEFVTYSKNDKLIYLKIQDYAYYIIIVKSFWVENFGNIYKLDFQQKALSSFVGTNISLAMPPGVTPVALLIWLPFACIANQSIALSYTFWTMTSLIFFIIALSKFLKNNYCENIKSKLPFYLIIVTIVSPATALCLLLGQTSIFAVGLFTLLVNYTYEKKINRKTPFDWIYISIVVFLSAIKPSYVALSFGILAIHGLWKEAILSSIFLSIYLISISPLLGFDWISSYKYLLSMYTSGNFPKEYAWSIVPSTMIVFRTSFRSVIGDQLGVLLSNIATIVIYFIVLWKSLVFLKNESKDLYNQKKTIYIILVSSYLLFAPYAGAYEDVFFMIIFLMVLNTKSLPEPIGVKGLALIALTLVVLSQNVLNLSQIQSVFWILKFLLIFIIIFYCFIEKEADLRFKF